MADLGTLVESIRQAVIRENTIRIVLKSTESNRKSWHDARQGAGRSSPIELGAGHAAYGLKSYLRALELDTKQLFVEYTSLVASLTIEEYKTQQEAKPTAGTKKKINKKL